jgi:hypothetical protein
MIAEELLERGLANAAEDYDVPDGGVERLRELLAPRVAEDEQRRHTLQSVTSWRPGRRGGLLAFAAALILLIAVPIAIGGKGGGGGAEGGGGTAASPASAPVVGGTVGGPTTTSGGGALSGYRPANAGRLDEAHRSVAQAVPSPAAQKAEDFSKLSSGGAPASSGFGRLGDAAQSPIPPIPGAQPRVVKNGQLDLRVAKGQVSATISRLTGLAASMRGYVSDSHTTEGSVDPSGEVTMRVPVDAFEQTVSRARAFGKVLSLETSGVDVTAKYVDLKARIKALQATRQTFLSIMSRAKTIGETLAVQDRITGVQSQIEQLQGQVKVLRNESAMSTLTVTVDQPTVLPKPAQAHHDNGFVKAVKLSVSRFVRGVEAIVGVIGPILLAVILVLLAWLGAKFGYRTVQRRMV